MKCKYFFALLNCIFWIGESSSKYLISANDSVKVHNCDLESVKNIADINANPMEIIIHSCHIDELPNALFIRFHRLRQLEISESQLQTLSDFALNGLNKLQLLILSRNNLTTVKTWSNENLEALHSLDLRRNAIASIQKDAFKFYPGLLKLNLAVNHIEEIPDELFRSLSHLKYLNLGKNNLASIDSHTFKHLHKLLHLELKHNQIEYIDAESFFGCTHLRVLHLQENLISSFDSELVSNMPRLHHLNLSHNLLEEFIDETFSKNEEMVSLDISYNKFEEFSKFTFKGLEVLEIFNASHNAIKHLEGDVFTDFNELRVLDLGNNQINRLTDKTFDSMTLLKSINLNNNSLMSIDDAVFSSLKLRRLDLSCNNLSSDNFLWSPSIDIEYLNLTFNEYTLVNVSVLENIIIDFWGNPFTCEWLVREALTSKNIRLGRKNYVVSSKHDILKVAGIQCFEGNGANVQKLIVVEANHEEDSEVESQVEMLQKSKDKFAVQPTIDNSDDFDYRSILLCLSLGCIVVFLALRILKCLLTKSERQSEEYRLSRQHEALSIDEDTKSTAIDIK